MEDYLSEVLTPRQDQLVQAPDLYIRKTSVFKLTGSLSLLSSVAKGHCLLVVYPQLITQAVSFASIYIDAASQLDVTNLPVIANLLASGTTGTNLSTYYSYVRLVGFELDFIYVGAELSQAGELSVGLDNIQQMVVGTNVKTNIQDGVYYTKGRSDKSFRIVWVPQDDTDFDFRSPSAVNKTQFWGSITAAGTGFPLNITTYDVTYTAVIEGIVLPSGLDFIPRSLSPAVDPNQAMLALKKLVIANPSLIASCGNETYLTRQMLKLVNTGGVNTQPVVQSDPWASIPSSRPKFDPTSSQSYTDYLNEGRPSYP